MEIFAKIIISLVLTGIIFFAIFEYVKTVRWTWKAQIDIQGTFKRYFKKEPTLTEKVATRDEEKVYKNGNPVGNISATVFEEEETVLFPQLTEAWSIQLHDVIEYKRHKLKVISISRKIAKKINKFSVKNNVLEHVKCEKLKDE